MTMFKAIILSVTMILLAGCGGSGSDKEPPVQPTSTTFSLGVSDAPVDSAIRVVVVFDEVELKSSNGQSVTFSVRDENDDPRAIDLLEYQGSQFAALVTNEEIPLGEYSQLRITVLEESYIEMDSGTLPLRVPSGELKLDGFTALPNVTAAYTLEFDLRRSLVDPVGQNVIMLKPRGVRLVENRNVGILEGTVSESLITDMACAEKLNADQGNAVYLFAATGVETGNLGDDADLPLNTNEVSPYAIAPVTFDEQSQTYSYQAGYVEAGQYTAAFTCLAILDQPESDENAEDGFTFQAIQEVTISAQQTSELNF